MNLLRNLFISLLGLVVVASATGIPHVVHLCTTVCESTASCCEEEEAADEDCCTDVIAIHQLQILRVAEHITPAFSKICTVVKYVLHLPQILAQVPASSACNAALYSYLHILYSDHPPTPEVRPLRL
ncbi:MAG: hypothetical protein J5I53_04235 [Bradyrhizobiaceae bacterium]|nr:hypothetical protein [Bradyrhizobiaceae bacterium]